MLWTALAGRARGMSTVVTCNGRTMAARAHFGLAVLCAWQCQGVAGFSAARPACVRVRGAARAAILAAGAREDGEDDAADELDFDFEKRIEELERRVPSDRKRDAALAEYGLSLPALVLLVLSGLLLGGTQIFGPGWLSALAGGPR